MSARRRSQQELKHARNKDTTDCLAVQQQDGDARDLLDHAVEVGPHRCGNVHCCGQLDGISSSADLHGPVTSVRTVYLVLSMLLLASRSRADKQRAQQVGYRDVIEDADRTMTCFSLSDKLLCSTQLWSIQLAYSALTTSSNADCENCADSVSRRQQPYPQTWLAQRYRPASSTWQAADADVKPRLHVEADRPDVFPQDGLMINSESVYTLGGPR